MYYMFWCQHQKFKNRKKLAPLYGEGTVLKDPHQLVKPLAIDIFTCHKFQALPFKKYIMFHPPSFSNSCY